MSKSSKKVFGFSIPFWILIIIGFILLIGYLESDKTEVSADSKFSQPWRSPGDEILGISKSLVKKEIRGCGEYYVRESKEDNGEYLVACTQDGQTWKYYLVWPRIEEVTGPLSDAFTPPR